MNCTPKTNIILNVNFNLKNLKEIMTKYLIVLKNYTLSASCTTDTSNLSANYFTSQRKVLTNMYS